MLLLEKLNHFYHNKKMFFNRIQVIWIDKEEKIIKEQNHLLSKLKVVILTELIGLVFLSATPSRVKLSPGFANF